MTHHQIFTESTVGEVELAYALEDALVLLEEFLPEWHYELRRLQDIQGRAQMKFLDEYAKQVRALNAKRDGGAA